MLKISDNNCTRLLDISMDHDILDLDNVPPFIEKDWIKAGKQYPKGNTPYKVLWAREDRLTIPELHLKHLPAQNLPIAQFLKHELPPQSAEIITTKAQSCFHPDIPITDIKALLKRPIPPVTFLHDLEKEFGQAWFDGARSIVDHRFNNSMERFPLWVLTVWKKLSETITV